MRAASAAARHGPLSQRSIRDGRREVPVCVGTVWGRATAGLAALVLASCGEPGPGSFESECIGSVEDARAPSLEVGADGVARVAWIAEAQARRALRLVEVEDGECSEPVELALGVDWSAVWSDAPALSAEADGDVWVAFPGRSGAVQLARDLRGVRREARTDSWSKPIELHELPELTEHGCGSLAALDPRGTLAVWLDGRQRVNGSQRGAMQLRARVLLDEACEPELVLDERVCDGCRTSIAVLDDGSALIGYRDRSADEVRDIAVVTWRAGSVSAPRPLFQDGWRIAGCPGNGPSLAAHGSNVGAAWFTLGVENRARVQVSFSTDRGMSFDAPLVLSRRDTDGMVSAAMDARGVLWVTWLERVDRELAEWMLACVTVERVGEPRALAQTVPGRAAGFAPLAARGDELLFAWLAPQQPPELRLHVLRGLDALR